MSRRFEVGRSLVGWMILVGLAVAFTGLALALTSGLSPSNSGQKGTVPPALAAGGDFSLDFTAAAPFTYAHSTGGGTFDDRTVGKNDDIVESLEAGDFTCDDIATFLIEIVVDDAPSDPVQTIQFDTGFTLQTTGQKGVGVTDIVNVLVNYESHPLFADGFGDSDGEAGNSDDGGSTATLVDEYYMVGGVRQEQAAFTDFCGTDSNDELFGTVQVDGLEAGEHVVVRVDVRLSCFFDCFRPTGNLQARLTNTQVVSPTPDTIPGGDQTIPWKQFGKLPTPTPTVTLTPTPTPTETYTPTPTETYTPTPTETFTPTPTETYTPTPTETYTPTPTETYTPTPTETYTPTPTETFTPTPTETFTPTPTETYTPTPTETYTPTPTETFTPTPTETYTPTPTETYTPTPTETFTPTPTETFTPTPTETFTPTPTETFTPTPTETFTPTPTETITPTSTGTPPATATPTSTPPATATPTSTPLATATPTSTPLATATPTSTPPATATPTSTPLAIATPTSTPPPIPVAEVEPAVIAPVVIAPAVVQPPTPTPVTEIAPVILPPTGTGGYSAAPAWSTALGVALSLLGAALVLGGLRLRPVKDPE